MAKKKKWYQVWTPIESKKYERKFSNTISQHQRQFDELGFEVLPEDDEPAYMRAYDTGWNRKLLDNSSAGLSKKELVVHGNQNSQTLWDGYKSTGSWQGYSYYQQPKLSYKYVTQMANMLSVQHAIGIQIGNSWEVDLINKKLTYNPASLIYGTKSELLATLMHEIGKLRYQTHFSGLRNKYVTAYKLPACEVLSCFEDVRVDYQMLKSYPSAGEIYESAMPSVEKLAKKYLSMGQAFRKSFKDSLDRFFHDEAHKAQRNGGSLNDTGKVFGLGTFNEVQERMNDLKNAIDKTGNVYEYCAEMLRGMYDLDTFGSKFVHQNIRDKVDATLNDVETVKKVETSQETLNILDKNVYPVVEDLLKDFTKENEQIKKAFPDLPEGFIDLIVKDAMYHMADKGQVSSSEDGKSKSRSSGPTDNRIPPEWQTGEYAPLKDSVADEIRQLVNRLLFIRREEMVVKYQGGERRGKLNAKKLYRSALGSRRLFKKKLPNIDTVQSFAFSVLLDISGSMNGSRIVHSTRAVVLFAEVFKKMNIPFEIVVFGSSAKHIKNFDDNLDKGMERKIGGLVRADGGGTNLDQGLDALKLKKRDEKNKIAIVITDGGVGNPGYFDEQYFKPWLEKLNIKSIGIGIECEAQMAKLCMGNSKVLRNASELPIEFSSIIKTLIKRK